MLPSEMIVLPMLYYVIHPFSHECLDSSRPLIEITFQKSKEQLLYEKNWGCEAEGGADKWCM